MNQNISFKLAEKDDDFLEVVILKHEEDSKGLKLVVSEDKSFNRVMSLMEEGYDFLIVRYENKPIGYAFGIKDIILENSYWNRGFYLTPEFRNRGIETEVINAQVNFAMSKGFKSMITDVTRNDENLKFYRLLGFKIRPDGTGYLAEKVFSK